jgi:hypothetical protein
VIAEGLDKFLVEGESWSFLPLSPLKYHELPNEWYPLPPVYNWISPQDEINETREQQRVHRAGSRDATRTRRGTIDETELNKLETGGDGVYAEVVEPDAIAAVPDAPLDGSVWTQLAATKEDFNFISGGSSESRGVPQADTATQANIIEGHSQLRESSGRTLVAEWLAAIARLLLLTLREKMQLPFWVKANNDPFAGDARATAQTVGAWSQVRAEQLGDLDVDVTVDVASLSPVSLDMERAAWNQVLALLTNPGLLALLMEPNPQSPDEPSPLLRKTLGFYNIKSDSEVKEIWRVGTAALAKLQMAMAMGAAAGGKGGPQGLPATPAQAPTGTPAPAARALP